VTAPITLRDSIVGRHHVQVLGSDGPTFEATHRIVLFDYVGCGRSDWAAYEPQRYASLNGYAQTSLTCWTPWSCRQSRWLGTR
jgi:pimeloyl-ACP methyl ester carboxylesterase